MNSNELMQLLGSVQDGMLTPQQAAEQLKNLAYDDLNYAKVDHHRGLRGHANEVIFGRGKQPEQIKGIVENMLSRGCENVMVTCATNETYRLLCTVTDDLIFHEMAEVVVVCPREIQKTDSTILVLTGGTADIPVAEQAAVVAQTLGNPVVRAYDVGVAGLHRLLAQLEQIKSAGVIIVAAGMDGALPSVVAGLADCPVIALPTSVGYGASFGGVAALLTMLNSCASGVGVVNIDNGFGAAYLASMINQKKA